MEASKKHVKERNNYWRETIKINNKEIHFKIDTGAECNVLPLEDYNKLSRVKLEKTNSKIYRYL